MRNNTYVKIFVYVCSIAIMATLISKYASGTGKYSLDHLLQTPVSATSTAVAYLINFDSNKNKIDTTFLKGYFVPNNEYLAFYFQKSDNSLQNIAVEKTKYIHYNLNATEFKNIKTNNFVGFWVGNIHFESGNYDFSFLKNNSTLSVNIDGNNIVDSQDKAGDYIVYLSKGFHKIEVTYIDNDNNFKLYLENRLLQDPMNIKDSTAYLSDAIANDNIYYVHVDGDRDGSKSIVRVAVVENSKPVLIILDSYFPVEWYVVNTEQTKVDKIIYDSRQGISSVDAQNYANIIDNADRFNFKNDYQQKTIDINKPPYTSQIGSILFQIKDVMGGTYFDESYTKNDNTIYLNENENR